MQTYATYCTYSTYCTHVRTYKRGTAYIPPYLPPRPLGGEWRLESEGRVIRQLAQAVHTIQPTWLDILDKMTRAEKMSPADQISVATKMYYMGFLFLPWMWFINYLYFRPVVKTPQASPQLKTSTPPRLQPMSRNVPTCVVSLQRMFCCSCPALPDRLHGLGGCVPRMGDILFFRAREARIVRPPLFHTPASRSSEHRLAACPCLSFWSCLPFGSPFCRSLWCTLSINRFGKSIRVDGLV